ncbi:lung seven transmembrane receptor-domain-containing protein, partial [Blyttiomyces helicus]
FFGILSVIYLIIGVGWMVVSFIHWRDLLPIQHYVSGVTIFLTLEMAFNYGYFEDFNHWGRSCDTLLVLVVVLNAGRNSISFFMLLIVALGYGVVKPTLGGTMQKCLYLTYTHFVFGVSYAAGSMLITEITGITLLLFVVPLATCMTVFYFWILSGLQATMTHLENRKQAEKLKMYKRLWYLLVFSVLVLSIFLLINSINFYHRTDPSWIPTSWRYRWFALDGFLNILYLVIFTAIALLWRPTENNQRYGLQEIPQEDDQAHVTIGGRRLRLRNLRQGDADLDEADLEEEEGDSEEEGDGEDDVLKWVEENVGRQ